MSRSHHPETPPVKTLGHPLSEAVDVPPGAVPAEQPIVRAEPNVVPTEEHILKVVHPAMFGNHPASFLIAWACIIAGSVGGFMLAATDNPQMSWLSLAVAVGAALFLGLWWLRLQFRTLTITEKRSLYRAGILSKFTNEVQHDDVRNIQMDQTLFQRLCGVGELAISSSGQDTMEIHVKGIHQPQQVIDIIRKYQ